MTAEQLITQLPPGVFRLLWSLVVILLIILMGQFLTRIVCRRLTVWASETAWKWDDLTVDVFRRGIPFWSLLFGLYVGSGFWQLPAHFQETLNKTLYVFAWLSVTVLAAGLSGKLIALYGSQFHQAMPVTSLTEHIAKIVITVLGVLTILHGMGVSITPLLTALGVGGLAVALALQDTLSNLFAGFYLTMARHIRVGDYIELESGQEGYVEDIGWRATEIRMLPNNMVLVPNNKLGQSTIINYYLPDRELIVTVNLGVDYVSDLAHVERVTTDVAREVMRTVPGGVPSFEPLVRYHSFGEYGINFTVVLRAREVADQFLIKHELVKRLHVRYRQEGITIPSPVRAVLAKLPA